MHVSIGNIYIYIYIYIYIRNKHYLIVFELAKDHSFTGFYIQ